MKTILTIGILLLMSSLVIQVKAQTSNDPNLPKNISDYSKEKPMVVDGYQQPYIIKDKKLATYFKSGQIPTDFPKFDYSKTKKENKGLIKDWYYKGNNKDLLSPEGRAKVAELQNK